MKYIRIFEKFESKNLSKILNYIKKGPGKTKFTDDIKAICHDVDYPLSDLSDSVFTYMKFMDAYILEDTLENKYIKFWFNIDGDYLGMSKYEIGSSGDGGLHDYEIDFSRDFKGYLSNLDNLQKIAIDIGRRGTLILATLWKNGRQLYAINNSPRGEGTRPNNIGWKEFGPFSWCIDSLDEYGEVYKASPKDKNSSKKGNPEKFNMPVNNKLKRLGYEFDIKSMVKNADFSLVLDLNLLKTEKNPSIKRNKRQIQKKDTLSIKKNEDIKKENIDRYLSKLSKYDPELGLDQIKKIVPRLFGWDHPLYFIWWDVNRGNLSEIISDVYLLIKTPTSDNNYYLDRISRRLKTSYQESSNISNKIKKNIKECRKKSISNGKDEILVYLDKYEKINLSINKYLQKGEISTILDLELVDHKVNLIKSILKNSREDMKLRYFLDYIYSSPNDAYTLIEDISKRKDVLKSMDDCIKVISNL